VRLKAYPRVTVECVGQAYVAFHHGTGATHVLSDVSVLVLQALRARPLDVDDVVVAVSADLDLAPNHVGPSVRSACDELLGAELLELA
jgi:PqqD family protein of HPr-rel-A system